MKDHQYVGIRRSLNLVLRFSIIQPFVEDPFTTIRFLKNVVFIINLIKTEYQKSELKITLNLYDCTEKRKMKIYCYENFVFPLHSLISILFSKIFQLETKLEGKDRSNRIRKHKVTVIYL